MFGRWRLCGKFVCCDGSNLGNFGGVKCGELRVLMWPVILWTVNCAVCEGGGLRSCVGMLVSKCCNFCGVKSRTVLGSVVRTLEGRSPGVSVMMLSGSIRCAGGACGMGTVGE